MKLEDAAAFTAGCFNGEPAPCSGACPYKLDIRSFLEKTEKGRWDAAYKAFRAATVFPVIASALCDAPCGNSCLRSQTGDLPIAMSLIEDACIRYAKNKKPDNYVIPPKTEKLAVVGAGLAGLSAALNLAQKKFPVTVFERNNGWGGDLRVHPRFDEFDAEIALNFSAVDVELRYGTEVKALSELDGFDAVYIATGPDGDSFGLLADWDKALLTTSDPRVFLGGGLTGADAAGSIMQGVKFSKTVEVFLQTGKAAETYGSAAGCPGALDYSSAARSARIEPSDGGYTAEEAKLESARCLKCDCDMCMASCEMLSTFRKKPKKIATEVFSDTNVNPPYSSHTLTRQAYSCTMCGHCKEVCPTGSDIGGLLQLSRRARVDGGTAYPEALHDYWLREMDFSTGDASFYAPGDGGYVFFPGCQLGAHNPEHVLKSYAFLQKEFRAGIFVGCCGAPAYWAGDSARQDTNLEHIRKISHELGNPKFVFACATCESVFEKYLPELQRISLYELLARSDDLKPERIFDAASVFDPCNARKNPEMEQAVRVLAQKTGTELHELSEKNRCCGYGGHMRLGNPELYDKITENRAAIGTEPYIVYCANCAEVFNSLGKSCAHILDFVFGLPVTGKTPDIEQRRKNALSMKKRLVKELSGVEFTPEIQPWDGVELIVSDELLDSLERKLISLSDIREAVWTAESTGDKFLDSGGVFRCCLEKPILTYWVSYKKTDGGAYEILEAYCHRMHFSRED